MIKHILAMAAALLTFSQYSADAAERRLSVFGFDSVKINGGVNVTITTGKGASAIASADSQRTLDRLQLRSAGSELIITVQQQTEDAKRYSGNDRVELILTTPALKQITHLGSGNVTVDELKARESFARIGGFGSIAIGAITADVLTIVMNGGGIMTVSGDVNEARVSLLGASSFDGSALSVNKLKLTQRGPSSTQIAVEREAEITSTGSGSIQIIGKPNCIVRSAGAAEIFCNPKT